MSVLPLVFPNEPARQASWERVGHLLVRVTAGLPRHYEALDTVGPDGSCVPGFLRSFAALERLARLPAHAPLFPLRRDAAGRVRSVAYRLGARQIEHLGFWFEVMLFLETARRRQLGDPDAALLDFRRLHVRGAGGGINHFDMAWHQPVSEGLLPVAGPGAAAIDAKFVTEADGAMILNDPTTLRGLIAAGYPLFFLSAHGSAVYESEDEREVRTAMAQLHGGASAYSRRRADEGRVSRRRKRSATIDTYRLTHVPPDRIDSLKLFHQGRNANGQAREPKLLITPDDFQGEHALPSFTWPAQGPLTPERGWSLPGLLEGTPFESLLS